MFKNQRVIYIYIYVIVLLSSDGIPGVYDAAPKFAFAAAQSL